MKIWEKGIATDLSIETFTVGKDREFDLLLAEADITGSLAHAQMLSECGLISKAENDLVQEELKAILQTVREGNFSISDSCEDIHSQIELLLTQKLGDTGKKIHTARSRNDQSLLDIKLFIRSEIQKVCAGVETLFNQLLALSEKHNTILLPGYTHFQVAMPSSFGLWFAAYAESFSDDLEMLLAAYKTADKNPLGSAAGFGSSFPINRERTTELLGFDTMNVNSVYAQMTRGKTEKFTSFAIAAIGSTLARLAMDCTLFMSQNFQFISFPDELTTGSSIMPHKKNPDVWELIRAKCNRLQSVPNEFSLLLTNLPSGYHRDLQLTKEILFPAFTEIQNCLNMASFMLEHISVNENILNDPKYDYLFTVDAVNKLVQEGKPFRDAYREIGLQVESGTFKKPGSISHTHTGSIGNPGNEKIKQQFEKQIAAFKFKSGRMI